MTNHERELMFQTMELLRKTTAQLFQLQHEGDPPDPKDVDDWIFSELPATTHDIEHIYKGKCVSVYTASAIEGPSPIHPLFDDLTPLYDMRANLRVTNLQTSYGTVPAVVVCPPASILQKAVLSSGDAPELDYFVGHSVWLTKTERNAVDPASYSFVVRNHATKKDVILYTVTEADT